jgi:transposase-like protein
VPNYHGYRFPPEIISHAIWLYHRFGLSFRDVEDLLARCSRGEISRPPFASFASS